MAFFFGDQRRGRQSDKMEYNNLITSKINPPPDDIINKFPYIIQFFIRDQSYGIALIIYLPTMLMLFAFKKLVLYSFRH